MISEWAAIFFSPQPQLRRLSPVSSDSWKGPGASAWGRCWPGVFNIRPCSHGPWHLQAAGPGWGAWEARHCVLPVKVGGQEQHGTCAELHGASSLTRQGKATGVTNARTRTGPRVCPLQNHGDLKDLLYYLSFPKTYLHVQRWGLFQTVSNILTRILATFLENDPWR